MALWWGVVPLEGVRPEEGRKESHDEPTREPHDEPAQEPHRTLPARALTRRIVALLGEHGQYAVSGAGGRPSLG